jgi:hypothetical protein
MRSSFPLPPTEQPGNLTACITEIFSDVIWQLLWEGNSSKFDELQSFSNNFLIYLRTIFHIIPMDSGWQKRKIRLRDQLNNLLLNDKLTETLDAHSVYTIIADIDNDGAQLRQEQPDEDERESFLIHLENLHNENFLALTIDSNNNTIRDFFDNNTITLSSCFRGKVDFPTQLSTANNFFNNHDWTRAAKAYRKIINNYNYTATIFSAKQKQFAAAIYRNLIVALHRIAITFSQAKNKVSLQKAYHFMMYALKEAETYTDISGDNILLTNLKLDTLTVINNYAQATHESLREALIYCHNNYFNILELTHPHENIAKKIEEHKLIFTHNLATLLNAYILQPTHSLRKKILMCKHLIGIFNGRSKLYEGDAQLISNTQIYLILCLINLSKEWSQQQNAFPPEACMDLLYEAMEVNTKLGSLISTHPQHQKYFFNGLVSSATTILPKITDPDKIQLLESIQEEFTRIPTHALTTHETFYSSEILRALGAIDNKLACDSLAKLELEPAYEHYYQAVSSLKNIPLYHQTHVDRINLAFNRQNYTLTIISTALKRAAFPENHENDIENIAVALIINAKACDYFYTRSDGIPAEKDIFNQYQLQIISSLILYTNCYIAPVGNNIRAAELLHAMVLQSDKMPMDELQPLQKVTLINLYRSFGMAGYFQFNDHDHSKKIITHSAKLLMAAFQAHQKIPDEFLLSIDVTTRQNLTTALANLSVLYSNEIESLLNRHTQNFNHIHNGLFGTGAPTLISAYSAILASDDAIPMLESVKNHLESLTVLDEEDKRGLYLINSMLNIRHLQAEVASRMARNNSSIVRL